MGCNTVGCVSMFYDIGRGGFANYKRSTDSYLSSFFDFFSRVECDLTVVCGVHEAATIEDYLGARKSIPFASRISFKVVERSQLPYERYRSAMELALRGSPMRHYSIRDSAQESSLALVRRRWRRYLRSHTRHAQAGSESIHGRLGLGAPRAPEYTSVDYLIVVLSKLWAMRTAVEGLSLAASRVTWMDFAFGHSDENFLKHSAGKTFVDPDPECGVLEYVRRGSGALPTSAWQFAELLDDALAPTGLMTIPVTMLSQVEEWWLLAFENHLKAGLVLDDQVLHGLYCAQNTDLSRTIEKPAQSVAPIHEWLPIDTYLAP